MKIFEYDGFETTIFKSDMENIFHVYVDPLGDEMFFNICRSINFKNLRKMDKRTYTVYTVQETDTWNLISYKFYKNIRYWWIICKLNGIVNPLVEPIPGTNLRILNENIVRDVLTLIKRS